jgi:hypothetical protein
MQKRRTAEIITAAMYNKASPINLKGNKPEKKISK